MKLAPVRSLISHDCLGMVCSYFQDVTTRGSYYPDKTLATAAVYHSPSSSLRLAETLQNPPLYLHVTSTSKAGLEKAIEKIENMMKVELPNLIDERRFRRREDTVERDEFGRVCM